MFDHRLFFKNKETHFSLQNALIDYLWETYTNDNA